MRKSRTIKGRWWIHGDDKPEHSGVLSYEPDEGLKLKLDIPHSRSGHGLWMSFLNPPPNVAPLIHGIDEHGAHVTLFGCHCIESQRKSNLDTCVISSLTALLNYRATSWTDARFSTVAINYSLLHQWMNRRSFKSSTTKDKKPAFELESHPQILLKLSDGVTLRLESSHAYERVSNENLNLHFEHRIWFHFDQPQSVETIYKSFAQIIRSLLCLLTGEHVFIDRIGLFEQDPFIPSKAVRAPTVVLLQENAGIAGANRKLHGTQMITSYDTVATNFERIVRDWFALYDRLGPVIDLYMLLHARSSPPMQNAFLFLAQALEVYHASSARFNPVETPRAKHKSRVKAILDSAPAEHKDWLKEKLAYSNQKTLATRLGEILDLNADESRKLTAGIEDFPAKVRHTRNYYTHYDPKLRKTAKIAKGPELIHITYALDALLEISLLKELGITGAPISKVIAGARDINVIELDPVPSAGIESAPSAPDYQV